MSTPTARSSVGKGFRAADKAAENADSIHVVCRFRPVKPNEVKSPKPVFQIDQTVNAVEIFLDDHDSRSFAFDKVYLDLFLSSHFIHFECLRF